MKKKIKDLTLKEATDICDKYETTDDCRYKCPLKDLCGKCVAHIADLDREEFDKEVLL